MTSDLLPTKAVAEELGITVRQVHYLIETGKLAPAMKGTGPRGPMFFRRSDINALLAEAQS